MKRILLAGTLSLLAPTFALAQGSAPSAHPGPTVHDRTPRIHDRAPRIHDNHQVVRA